LGGGEEGLRARGIEAGLAEVGLEGLALAVEAGGSFFLLGDAGGVLLDDGGALLDGVVGLSKLEFGLVEFFEIDFDFFFEACDALVEFAAAFFVEGDFGGGGRLSISVLVEKVAEVGELGVESLGLIASGAGVFF